MASLVEFHKWAKWRLDKDNFKGAVIKWNEYKVDLYKRYLTTQLGMPCCDHYWYSHFGENANKCIKGVI